MSAAGELGHGSAWVQLCSHIEVAAGVWLGDVNVGAIERLCRDFREFDQILNEEDIKGCHVEFQHRIRAKFLALQQRY